MFVAAVSALRAPRPHPRLSAVRADLALRSRPDSHASRARVAAAAFDSDIDFDWERLSGIGTGTGSEKADKV